MSTMEAASDVLADLDELDSVMGVETQDQQDLKPKQVRLHANGAKEHEARGVGVTQNKVPHVARLRLPAAMLSF